MDSEILKNKKHEEDDIMKNINTIMDTNLEVRSFHDTTMREAFQSAVEMMNGADFNQIGNAEYKHVRDFLCESIAYWMERVGLHNKLASGYLSLSSDNTREDLSSFFFSSGCINNRLTHFLEMTAEHGTHAALKSLQFSVNNIIRDHLPSGKSDDEKNGESSRSHYTTVSIDDVEGILSTPDCHCPERTTVARQNLSTFWKMLYEKPFLDVVFYLSQPLDMTRQELASHLLNAKQTLELIMELQALYTELLGDAIFTQRLFLPIIERAKSYQPASEYISNPKTLINRLNRYTTENGPRDKFKAAFYKVIAA
jgi:hypothetical protein